ncbi:fumarylacetoacetate hydrolase family protein [Pseudoteredinibacter isoporae]|uniref:5-carboxymethyl-2-hydroxymuconate isomerase n=1 Tax=Pseudoteredinibacter isoporae TaxID=570281 RepID=A0A7X0MWT1_9GAMM|nr:fumarylacetoacetate hydrolase family protein [Pseudoteredinibacter isoporae]MBB6523051.1 5-carboxymethyl-2-hydroxymuconate isomerase [Pseudoteredinibacter isoporae]NHO88571.1 fumarylacetoacetate hydrolase family protein [Pseudoteredinibacter isoporae]NIB22738.1 fumarylacetoacetate hydrolase family protein [Pseudoteredinibacter isoporae]
MRFISFKSGDKVSWGVLQDDGIIDLGAKLQGSLFSILREGRLDEARELAARSDVDLKEADIELLQPVLTPEKIACIGVNYANRNAEYKDGSEQPKFPSLFMRTSDSFTAHRQPLWRPPESDQLDYEGEIVIVIGKEGRRIAEEDAYDHIAGLSIMNEGTLRDWVRHAKFNVTQGKNFINSGSIGPWMVSADEFSAEDYENMRVRTWVNGELRQDDTTASMMFPFKYIISYLSKFYHLKPGDVIATGTPNGAGARFDPPKYLQPGDEIKVEVEGVGTLINGVIDEPL